MRDLDRSKVYDLSDLNKKQRETLYDWLVKNDVNWENIFKGDFIKTDKDVLIYDGTEWDLDWIQRHNIGRKQVITNALELFEEEEDNPNMSISWSNIEVKYKTPGN